MANVTVLYNPGYQQSTEKAVEKVSESSFDAVLLGLPEQLERTVREHIDGGISEETVWKEYRLLTGLHEKFVDPVRRRLRPLLTHLRRRTIIEPETRVFCYQDLSSHVESGRVAERLLLLQMAERMRRQVRVEEWRTAFANELESSVSSWERSLDNLSEKAGEQDSNLLPYAGLIRPVKDYLLAQGFSVRIVSLGRYWRSPIEVLRALMWLRGPNRVSDEEIAECVRQQMRYLDLVLSSESLDVAHEKWIAMRVWMRSESAT